MEMKAAEKVSKVVHRHADILGGAPVFVGTRVPVEALFDYLKYGTVEEFLKGYPQVSKAQVDAVLEMASQKLLKSLQLIPYENAA